MERSEMMMACRYAPWTCRLEDPAALRFFYAWLCHPGCGGKLVSAIGSLYTTRGISLGCCGDLDLREELRQYSMPAANRGSNVAVPKSKYDIWDVCASDVLGIPQRNAFVRLALTLSTYDAPPAADQDHPQLLDEAILVSFRDAAITKVFKAMVENFKHQEQAFSEHGPADVERLEMQVNLRECASDQLVDFGRVAEFMDETKLVLDVFFTLLSLTVPAGGVEEFLTKSEHDALEARFDSALTPLKMFARLFVTQVMPSSPVHPEAFRPLLDKLRRGADLSLWPCSAGPRYAVMREMVMSIVEHLLESEAVHEGSGLQINCWLRTRSLMFPSRLKKLHTELFQLEPALDEMRLLYDTWRVTGRGKLKSEQLERLISKFSSVAAMLWGQRAYFLSCCSQVLGAEYATSFANLVAVLENSIVAPAFSQRCCEPTELETIRFKACKGAYQVLEPLKVPDYSRDRSLNKLLLVLLEDICDEAPGTVTGFTDLQALDQHPDLELDCATIVARKEVASEVAHLYVTWSGLQGADLRLAGKYSNKEQLLIINAVATYRLGPPFPVSKLDPSVCREADLDLHEVTAEKPYAKPESQYEKVDFGSVLAGLYDPVLSS